jgi:hypothetical protein
MTLSELQRLAVKEAYAAYFRIPTSVHEQTAKELLQNADTSATALLVSARYLLGPHFTAYEPETLWHELPIHTSNRDKLMAGVALALTPSFYWDYRVFGATTHALTQEMVSPNDVPKCDSAQMAWAAFEAELLFALTDGESTRPEYDESVAAYVGVSLFDEGLVLPPVGLGFALEELTSKLSADSLVLQKETEAAWQALPKEELERKARTFDISALGAQLGRLAVAWRYVEDRTKHLRRELATFEH